MSLTRRSIAIVLLSAAVAALLVAKGRRREAPQALPAPVTNEERAALVHDAAAWITAERDRWRLGGRALAVEERRQLEPFFPPQILDAVRVVMVDSVENPDFLETFAATGRPRPIDMRYVKALALVDTVMVVRSPLRPDLPPTAALLFHELVHLTQFEILGLEEYLVRYIDSWADNGFSYRDIPQEAQAYELAQRFRSAPTVPFSVMDEVQQLFGRAVAASL